MHPEGRGAHPSCLLRHIPVKSSGITPQTQTYPIVAGVGQVDDMRSVTPHLPHPIASNIFCAWFFDAGPLEVISQKGSHQSFNALQVVYLIIKKIRTHIN
jgi:hypothetical protein